MLTFVELVLACVDSCGARAVSRRTCVGSFCLALTSVALCLYSYIRIDLIATNRQKKQVKKN